MSEDKQRPNNERGAANQALWVGVGVALGVVLGTVMDNLVLGIALGVMIALAFITFRP